MKHATTKRREHDDLDLPEVNLARARVVRRGPAGKRVSLRTLREALGKTQNDLAAALDMTQSEVSRLESRDDVLVSTLARYAAALGGALETIIVLPSTGHRIRLALGVSASRRER
jgi:DNA-binding Xre family transcriptional regulator